MPINTGQAPFCPMCGAKMVLRKKRSNPKDTFWGCPNYFRTKCKGLLNHGQAHLFMSSSSQIKSWTDQQEAIFAAGIEGIENVFVGAGPGTGKTTTNVELGKRLSQKYLGLAFNKHIADEWAAKDRKNEVRTTHSFALRECHTHYGDFKLDVEGKKYRELIWAQLDCQDHIADVDKKEVAHQLSRLIDLARSTLNENPLELADYYGMAIDIDLDLFRMMFKFILEQGRANLKVLDFTDLIYYIWFYKLPVRQFPRILGDEVQDWNASQLYLVQQALEPGGSLIAVGDEHQALYGFRGADCDSIPNLIKTFSAKVLPLTLSFRCAKAIVERANQLVPELRAAPDAPEGEILYDNQEGILRNIKRGDMMLCRTNAPLVAPVYSLIRRGVKATIRGRDIGRGLLLFIEKFEEGSATLTELLIKMDKHAGKRVEKLVALARNGSAQALQDKAETIVQISLGADSITQLKKNIDMLFGDNSPAVVASTVHKAKGLEADRVVILRPDLMPHPLAKKDWEMRQEINIIYVATTRAKNQLTFEVK